MNIEFAPPVRVQLLTLPFHPSLGAIDSRPLDAFVADKELLAVRDHFFIANGTPHLLCVVIYRLPRGSEALPAGARGRPPRERIELDEAGRALFETLRVWRSERARRDGVPPYVVFNNRELADLASQRPTTANGLLQIAGLGAAKVERYGQELLAILAPNQGAACEATQ
jgi:ATP-dependent DNA helicase RecQ